MKKTILLVVMVTLVAFVSGAIAADAPKAATTAPAPAKVEKFSGDIKNVDATAKSIVVAGKGKVEKSFVVNAETKITKGKEALKLEDLKAGINVAVEYKKDGDKNIAAAIKLPTPKPATKK